MLPWSAAGRLGVRWLLSCTSPLWAVALQVGTSSALSIVCWTAISLVLFCWLCLLALAGLIGSAGSTPGWLLQLLRWALRAVVVVLLPSLAAAVAAPLRCDYQGKYWDGLSLQAAPSGMRAADGVLLFPVTTSTGAPAACWTGDHLPLAIVAAVTTPTLLLLLVPTSTIALTSSPMAYSAFATASPTEALRLYGVVVVLAIAQVVFAPVRFWQLGIQSVIAAWMSYRVVTRQPFVWKVSNVCIGGVLATVSWIALVQFVIDRFQIRASLAWELALITGGVLLAVLSVTFGECVTRRRVAAVLDAVIGAKGRTAICAEPSSQGRPLANLPTFSLSAAATSPWGDVRGNSAAVDVGPVLPGRTSHTSGEDSPTSRSRGLVQGLLASNVGMHPSMRAAELAAGVLAGGAHIASEEDGDAAPAAERARVDPALVLGQLPVWAAELAARRILGPAMERVESKLADLLSNGELRANVADSADRLGVPGSVAGSSAAGLTVNGRSAGINADVGRTGLRSPTIGLRGSGNVPRPSAAGLASSSEPARMEQPSDDARAGMLSDMSFITTDHLADEDAVEGQQSAPLALRMGAKSIARATGGRELDIAAAIWDAAARAHHNSCWLALAHALWLAEVGDAHALAAAALSAAARLAGSWLERSLVYIVERRLQAAARGSSSTSDGKGLNLAAYVEFTSQLRQAQRAHRRVLLRIRMFWKLVQQIKTRRVEVMHHRLRRVLHDMRAHQQPHPKSMQPGNDVSYVSKHVSTPFSTIRPAHVLNHSFGEAAIVGVAAMDDAIEREKQQQEQQQALLVNPMLDYTKMRLPSRRFARLCGMVEADAWHAEVVYRSLIDSYPTNPKVLRAAGRFFLNVQLDATEGERLWKEADRIDAADDDEDAGAMDAPEGRSLAQRAGQLSLATAVDDATDALVVIDSKGVILSANANTRRMFGRSEAELVGHNVSILMPQPHAANHDRYLQRYMATGEAHVLGRVRRLEGLHKEGFTFPIELAVNRVDSATGVTFAGIIHQLRDDDAVGHLTINRKNVVVACDRAFARQFGYATSAILGRPVRNFMPRKEGARFEKLSTRTAPDAWKTSVAKSWHSGLNRHGLCFPISVEVEEEGQGPVAILRCSVTELANAHGALTMDARGVVQSCNSALLAIFGFRAAADIVGRPVTTLMPEPYATFHDTYIRRFLETGSGIIVGGRGRYVSGKRADGQPVHIYLRVNAVHDARGRRLFAAQIELASKHLGTGEGAENEEDPLLGRATISSSAIIQFVNKPLLRMFGYENDSDLVGKNVKILCPPDIARQHDSFVQNRVAGGAPHVIGTPGRHMVASAADGHLFPIALQVEEERVGSTIVFHGTIRSLADLEGLLYADFRGRIVEANDPIGSLLGHKAASLVGKNVKMLMPERFAVHHDEYLRNYRHTGEVRFTGRRQVVPALHADGSELTVQVEIATVRHDKHGECLACRMTAATLTLEEAEAAIQHVLSGAATSAKVGEPADRPAAAAAGAAAAAAAAATGSKSMAAPHPLPSGASASSWRPAACLAAQAALSQHRRESEASSVSSRSPSQASAAAVAAATAAGVIARKSAGSEGRSSRGGDSSHQSSPLRVAAPSSSKQPHRTDPQLAMDTQDLLGDDVGILGLASSGDDEVDEDLIRNPHEVDGTSRAGTRPAVAAATEHTGADIVSLVCSDGGSDAAPSQDVDSPEQEDAAVALAGDDAPSQSLADQDSPRPHDDGRSPMSRGGTLRGASTPAAADHGIVLASGSSEQMASGDDAQGFDAALAERAEAEAALRREPLLSADGFVNSRLLFSLPSGEMPWTASDASLARAVQDSGPLPYRLPFEKELKDPGFPPVLGAPGASGVPSAPASRHQAGPGTRTRASSGGRRMPGTASNAEGKTARAEHRHESPVLGALSSPSNPGASLHPTLHTPGGSHPDIPDASRSVEMNELEPMDGDLAQEHRPHTHVIDVETETMPDLVAPDVLAAAADTSATKGIGGDDGASESSGGFSDTMTSKSRRQHRQRMKQLRRVKRAQLMRNSTAAFRFSLRLTAVTFVALVTVQFAVLHAMMQSFDGRLRYVSAAGDLSRSIQRLPVLARRLEVAISTNDSVTAWSARSSLATVSTEIDRLASGLALGLGEEFAESIARESAGSDGGMLDRFVSMRRFVLASDPPSYVIEQQNLFDACAAMVRSAATLAPGAGSQRGSELTEASFDLEGDLRGNPDWRALMDNEAVLVGALQRVAVSVTGATIAHLAALSSAWIVTDLLLLISPLAFVALMLLPMYERIEDERQAVLRLFMALPSIVVERLATVTVKVGRSAAPTEEEDLSAIDSQGMMEEGEEDEEEEDGDEDDEDDEDENDVLNDEEADEEPVDRLSHAGSREAEGDELNPTVGVRRASPNRDGLAKPALPQSSLEPGRSVEPSEVEQATPQWASSVPGLRGQGSSSLPKTHRPPSISAASESAPTNRLASPAESCWTQCAKRVATRVRSYFRTLTRHLAGLQRPRRLALVLLFPGIVIADLVIGSSLASHATASVQLMNLSALQLAWLVRTQHLAQELVLVSHARPDLPIALRNQSSMSFSVEPHFEPLRRALAYAAWDAEHLQTVLVFGRVPPRCVAADAHCQWDSPVSSQPISRVYEPALDHGFDVRAASQSIVEGIEVVSTEAHHLEVVPNCLRTSSSACVDTGSRLFVPAHLGADSLVRLALQAAGKLANDSASALAPENERFALISNSVEADISEGLLRLRTMLENEARRAAYWMRTLRVLVFVSLLALVMFGYQAIVRPVHERVTMESARAATFLAVVPRYVDLRKLLTHIHGGNTAVNDPDD